VLTAELIGIALGASMVVLQAQDSHRIIQYRPACAQREKPPRPCEIPVGGIAGYAWAILAELALATKVDIIPSGRKRHRERS
jgi:hypothetical protein